MTKNSLYIPKQIPFTQLPNDLIRNPDISSNAKALYAYMLSRGDNWHFYVTEIMKNMKDGRDRIYKSLDELEQYGYLSKEINRNEGKFAGTQYILHFSPFTEMPDTAKPDTANQTLRIKSNNNKDNTKYRATLLNEDWLNSKECYDCIDWAVFERNWEKEDARTESEKFFNYWTSLGDSKRSRKSDWVKTFKNWILNAENYRRKSNKSNTQNSNGLASAIFSAKD